MSFWIVGKQAAPPYEKRIAPNPRENVEMEGAGYVGFVDRKMSRSTNNLATITTTATIVAMTAKTDACLKTMKPLVNSENEMD